VLTFVIPVRHPSSIADPTQARALMAETVASVAAQTHPDWACFVAAEKDADLPPLPPGFEVVRTDIPAPVLPPMHVDRHTNRQLVRMDKGARIMTALVAAQPAGHVMVVDYDDLISRRLAALAAERPKANGWYAERGWLYSGGGFVSTCPEDFSRLCGTSIVVHSRLLKIPELREDIDLPHVARTLGDHIYIRADLAEAGTPLDPLPFPGAVYRVGHANSASVSVSMLSRLLNTTIIRTPENAGARFRYFRRFRGPREIVQNLARLRPLTTSLRREFFGAAAA
jgi:hypothetical protein